MKVLHVAESAKGGVGSYLNEIVPYQIARYGTKMVRVVAPREHAGQVNLVPTAATDFFPRPQRSIASMLNLVITVSRTARKFRPDLIHAHSTFAGIVVRLLFGLRSSRPAIVYCPHGWAFFMRDRGAFQGLARMLERFLAPLCDRIIAVSEHEATEGLGIGIDRSRMSLIRNAISTAPLEMEGGNWDDTRKKVLFVGRLDRQKGFDLLLAAIEGLEDQITVRAAGGAVVSDGTPQAFRNVDYLGWLGRGEIEGQLSVSDLVVIPSRWEGLPLVALEAMRAGKPVVATTVGGLPEVVVDGITGRLVPPEDPNALREALLMDDLASLREMGRQGKQRFDQYFSINNLHLALFKLYGDVLRNRRNNC